MNQFTKFITTERVRKYSHLYLRYMKFVTPIGAGLGFFTSLTIISDISNERKLLNTEKLLYPTAGIIGGSFVGITLPVWLFLAPVGMVLSNKTMSSIAKVIILSAMAESSDEKKNNN